jgi:hypothetical protein
VAERDEEDEEGKKERKKSQTTQLPKTFVNDEDKDKVEDELEGKCELRMERRGACVRACRQGRQQRASTEERGESGWVRRRPRPSSGLVGGPKIRLKRRVYAQET